MSLFFILQYKRVLVLSVICAVLAVSKGQTKILEIFPSSDIGTGDESQMSVDDGLKAVQSDMTLLIHKGVHIVSDLWFIRDLSDVTIQGNAPAEQVIITCAQGVGLAFFNLNNLQIQNVTIDRCGLNRSGWEQIYPTLINTFETMIQIPRVLRVGILIAACRDMTLENLKVHGTRGIGLLAVSPLGSTQLINVEFERNEPPACPTNIENLFNDNYFTWIGGGAYFLYQDLMRQVLVMRHSLTVRGGWFKDNRDCSITVLLENFVEQSTELTELGYQVGAGGGLTIMMAQTRFTVDVSITDGVFENNVARNGGGVHIGLFSGIPSQSTILVNHCNFRNNGKTELATSGGGMVINIDLVRPSQIRGEQVLQDAVGGVRIDVQDSIFDNNMARIGGGVAIISHYAEQHVFDSKYEVNFQNCLFVNNRGFGGSALLVYELKHSGFEPGLQLTVSDSSFVDNSRMNSNSEIGNTRDYGVLHIRNVNLMLSGDNSFRNNRAPALGAVASLVQMSDHVTFAENRAVNGAGMQLLSRSVLILHRDVDISFVGNRAEITGGAIFIQNSDNFTFAYDDCFLYFNEPGYGLCTDETRCLPNNVTVRFEGNRARFGSLIYGSALTTCPWLSTLRKNSTTFNPMLNVYENLQNTFIFDKSQPIPPRFSTPAARLLIKKDLNISVMPGEQFFLELSAQDDFNNEVPQVITSSVIDKDAFSVIGDFGFFEFRPNRQIAAPITVFGNENIDSVSIRLTTIDLEADMMVNIRLTPCVVGFTHSEGQCVCNEQLISRGVSCNTNNFTVDDNTWLGPVHYRPNITNNDLTVTSCVLNYCKDGSKEIKSGEWDLQCRENFHRAGRLCGHCEDGYSLQLGTNACAKCTNWSIFLLIFFLLAGIFLVFTGTFLQISVAEGFFVAIIFYSNIITLFAVYFNNNEITGVNFLTAFLSLNFGIPACFYDGMDALALSALQLAFVAYLFILAVVHILLDRRVYFKFIDTMNQKYSPSKTFATLVIISYVSILQSTVGILSFTVASSFDGDKHVFWYMDPSVNYFTGFHIALGVIAIVLLFVLLIPPPILFMFCSQAIYRWPYFNKLKPFYDALFAPYKVKFRPWLGFQLIFRIVLFFIAYFVPTPHNLLVAAICLILYLHLQTRIQPYNSMWANHLESTLIVNSLLYVMVTLYFGNLSSVNDLSILLSVIFLAVIAYCIIIFAFLRHVLERNPKLFEMIKNTFRRKKKGKKEKIIIDGIEMFSPITPSIRVVDSIGNDVSHIPEHRQMRSASVDFLNTISDNDRRLMGQEFEVSCTEYREPLLDEGELDIHTSYSVVISPNSSASGSPTSRHNTRLRPQQLRPPFVKAKSVDVLNNIPGITT